MSDRRYTAQEMRETEKRIRDGLAWYDGSDTPEIRKTMKGSDCDTAWRMLRQAADAGEENAQLKARLEAVVKKLEILKRTCGFDFVDEEDVDEILRSARGESENK